MNLYGLNNSIKKCFYFLRKVLFNMGWLQSEVDSWLLTKYGIILISYVEDTVLISPDLHKTKI